MNQFQVTFQPDQKNVFVRGGSTILEAAGLAGIIINTPCGGSGTCGKCAVRLGTERGESVLACQHKIEADLTVYVPREARFFQQQILDRGIDAQIHVSPSICKVYLSQTPRDGEHLLEQLGHMQQGAIHTLEPEAATRLEQIRLSYDEPGVTVVLHQIPRCDCHAGSGLCYKVLCLESGDTTQSLYGVAVDIGTTTVVAKLIDLSDGQCKATAAMANPQIKYGDDVVSRISHASTENGYAKLHDIIIECLNGLIERLCSEHGVQSSHIYELTAAGNTTMSHLFVGFPVEQLGQAPYEAYSKKAEDRNAREMRLGIHPCGNIHVIENIAGFVGSDTTAVGLAVGIDRVDATTLVVDIGTNGELILAAGEMLYAASCAAGPALEGARISQGSRAVPGAIEHVVVNDKDIAVEVIGGGVAESICGSGLIDLMAVLLDLGIVDETGRYREPDELRGKLPDAIVDRIIEKDGQGAFVLVREGGADGQPVLFTQKDIRETQLSKGAIRAGIKLLQKEAGISDEDIQHVLLAGAFGNYIRRKSAWRIGLLPNVPRERIRYVGNAASTGAQMVLLSDPCRNLSAELVEKIRYVEIAHQPEFQMVFAECLMFDDPSAMPT